MGSSTCGYKRAMEGGVVVEDEGRGERSGETQINESSGSDLVTIIYNVARHRCLKFGEVISL